MSKYAQLVTEVREEKYLVEALKEMGYEVEVHPDGAFGDIGFARQPDGRLVAIVDEIDQQRGYGAKWLGRVQQLYKEKQTLATARAKGYILKSREVIETHDGQQVRLQFVVRR